MMKKIAIISLFIIVILLSKANSNGNGDKNGDNNGGDNNGDNNGDNSNEQDEMDDMFCGVECALCHKDFKDEAIKMFMDPLIKEDRNNGSNWLKDCDMDHKTEDLHDLDLLAKVIEGWCSKEEKPKKKIWKCSGKKCVDHVKKYCEKNEDDEPKKEVCDRWSKYLGDLNDIKTDAEDTCDCRDDH